MWKRVRVMFCVMSLFLVMSGCALQSNMVEMESDVETLRKHRWELQGRLERLEKRMREIRSEERPDKKKQSADMVVRVDNMTTDFQVLSGLVSEDRHLLSGISKRMEDQAFRTQDLLNRLDDLESRLFAVEAGGGLKKAGNRVKNLRSCLGKKPNFHTLAGPCLRPRPITWLIMIILKEITILRLSPFKTLSSSIRVPP